MAGSTKIRYIRVRTAAPAEDESQIQDGLFTGAGTSDYFDLEAGREGDSVNYDEDCGVKSLKPSHLDTHHSNDSQDELLQPTQTRRSRWTRRRRIPLPTRWITCGRRRRSSIALEKSDCGPCYNTQRPLRIVLKSLAIALMLLGLIEFVALAAGLVASFFPSEFKGIHSSLRAQRPSGPLSQWPTDYTADIQPIQCHSHNDYWRPVPLKSAITAGCTGVEADVWLFPDQAAGRASDELYIGHSISSLTPQRTFRSLYVDPLVEILERQNPNTTLHPTLDNPRNGIFDTDPSQTLVLLIDFKTDGQKLWPVVSQQLQPLRELQYLTHFNGTDVVDGPITVVVTGNAPFNKVVENAHYRDMFFDAPLELLGSLVPSPHKSGADASELERWSRYDDVEERTYLASYASELASSLAAASSKPAKNQGQGHSGAAPKNPAIYTPANSYYASVSFGRGVGYPIPFLTHSMKQTIRRQIAGAHKQGLKVRYWSTPSWPRGLREYIWRVLVEEGIDYLNVDDLQAATQGEWGAPRRHHRWGLSDWSIWSRR